MIHGRDLSPSAGPRETRARLGPVEWAGLRLGEASGGEREGDRRARTTTRGPRRRQEPETKTGLSEQAAGREGAAGGRAGRKRRAGRPGREQRSQLQRRLRAGELQGKCSWAWGAPPLGAKPLLSAGALRGEQASRHSTGTPRDLSPPKWPSVLAFSSTDQDLEMGKGSSAGGQTPLGTPALPRVVIESVGGEGQETRTGPGGKGAPLGLSYLPLKMGVLIRTTLLSGIWAR